MPMLRRVLFFCTAFGLFQTLVVVGHASPNNPESNLQGTWQAVDGEANGQKAADDTMKEMQLLIKENRLEIKPDGEGRKTTFTLNAGKTPKAIDLTPLDGGRKGTIVPAIYSVEDGQLRICINIWGKDPARRPTDFKTQPGDGCVFVTFKRITQDR